MIHKLPDNAAEYVRDSGLNCAICGEPFQIGECPDAVYDCVWADELYGLLHESCAEDKIAEMEARQDCEVCVKNGTTKCTGDCWTRDCFESRYK
jgi:hypothetical protein